MKLSLNLHLVPILIGHIFGLPTIFKQETINEDRTLVLFTFSGLRWDTLNNYEMPTLNYLKNHGVSVDRKIDAFQTESLPSFVTMLTGTYPEYNGILSNRMKNLKTGDEFDATKTDLKWWGNAEPLWVTNDKNGSSSALCYIPGHDVKYKMNHTVLTCASEKYSDPFKDLLTKRHIKESKVMPFSERINFVKTVLNMTKNRPTFIGVYFEEPYYSVMRHGLRSRQNDTLTAESKKAFAKIENVTREMVNYLLEQNLFEKINFVVTGESGFTQQPDEYGIFLEDYINQKTYKDHKYSIIEDGPIMQIFPQDESTKETLLKELSNKHKHLTVFDGQKLPANFHYSNSNLTPPILIVPDEEWRIYDQRIKDNRKVVMGYDGKSESTHSLFIAHGPAFNELAQEKVIGNVDVYNILCKTLKIKPHPNSGNSTIISALLRKPRHWIQRIVYKVVSAKAGIIAIVIISMTLLFISLYLIICSIYRSISCCVCSQKKKPLKVKLSTSKKLFKAKDGKLDGEHLLSENELSSEFSDTDDELGIGKRYNGK